MPHRTRLSPRKARRSTGTSRRTTSLTLFSRPSFSRRRRSSAWQYRNRTSTTHSTRSSGPYYSGNRTKFQQSLKAQGYTLATFRETLRASVLTRKVLAAATSDVKVDDPELVAYYTAYRATKYANTPYERVKDSIRATVLTQKRADANVAWIQNLSSRYTDKVEYAEGFEPLGNPGCTRLGVPAAAFFDLDRTLIASSSSLALAEQFHQHGLIGRHQLLKARLAEPLLTRFGAPPGRAGQATDSAMAILKGLPVSPCCGRSSPTLGGRRSSHSLTARRSSSRRRTQRTGDRVFIVSGALQEIGDHIASELGLDGALCSLAETNDGRYTGRLERRLLGQAKADALVDFAAAECLDLLRFNRVLGLSHGCPVPRCRRERRRSQSGSRAASYRRRARLARTELQCQGICGPMRKEERGALSDTRQAPLLDGRACSLICSQDAAKRKYPTAQNRLRRGADMSDSVYRVTEVIGASSDSWEAAARNAVETAGRTIRDLRVAEATRFDVTIKDGKVAEYRVRLDISFKYESED